MNNFKDTIVKLAYDNPGKIQDAILPALKKVANTERLFREVQSDPSNPMVLASLGAQLKRHIAPVGQYDDNGKIRWQRKADSFRVYDLTNEGKARGDSPFIAAWDLPAYTDQSAALVMMMIYKLATADFNAAKKIVKEGIALIEKAKEMTPRENRYEQGLTQTPKWKEGTIRSRQLPSNPIDILNNKGVQIRIDDVTFIFVDKEDPNQMAMSVGSRRPPNMIAKLKKWYGADKSKIMNMSYAELRKELEKLKIPYREWAMMD